MTCQNSFLIVIQKEDIEIEEPVDYFDDEFDDEFDDDFVDDFDDDDDIDLVLVISLVSLAICIFLFIIAGLWRRSHSKKRLHLMENRTTEVAVNASSATKEQFKGNGETQSAIKRAETGNKNENSVFIKSSVTCFSLQGLMRGIGLAGLCYKSSSLDKFDINIVMRENNGAGEPFGGLNGTTDSKRVLSGLQPSNQSNKTNKQFLRGKSYALSRALQTVRFSASSILTRRTTVKIQSDISIHSAQQNIEEDAKSNKSISL